MNQKEVLFCSFKPRRSFLKIFHIVLITVCIWIAFGIAINHDFVWDDHGLIINNQKIRDLSSLHDFFARSFWNIDEDMQDKTRSFYRPLIMSSYAADYHLYGFNPKGFHLTNILAHILCAIIVYMLAIRLLKDRVQAFIAALIWAIHPTRMENVVWISGRTDIFAGMFYFLSCYFFFVWMTNLKRTRLLLGATCVCYALALHCKEMAVTLPFLLCIAYFLMENKKRGFTSFGVMFAFLGFITVEYLVVRHMVLGNIANSTLSSPTTEILLSLPLVFAKYIGLVFGLVPTDPHHSETLCMTAWSSSFFLNFVVILAYATVLGTVWLRHKNTLLFCFLWFPVTLAPVFALGGFGDILYADRFLYIPSVGLIFASVSVVYAFVKRKGKIIRGAAALLCVFYLVMNISYSRVFSSVWKDNLSLFSTAVRTSPDSAYIHYNLGNSLSDAEAYPEALIAYNNAISLLPQYAQAHDNKAFVLNRMERYKEAMACLEKVFSLEGVRFTTLINLGDALMGFGDTDAALNSYMASLALKETTIGHHQLALCLMKQGKYDEAYEHLTKALSIKLNPRVLNSLGTLFLERGNPDKAIAYSKRALSRLKRNGPSNLKLEIHYTLARALMQKGPAQEAHYHIRQSGNMISLGFGAPSVREKIIKWLETEEKT
jgi:protein O-mannosyl-transferase